MSRWNRARRSTSSPTRLAEAVRVACKLENAREIAKFRGTKMERVTFQHPFLDRSVLGVNADYVTADQGTGAVHTAPAHGADDFYTGTRYGLDQTCNVDNEGRMRNGRAEWEGLTVFEANEPIIKLLSEVGALMGRNDIYHSYPHCWRCHNPVIFRATEQWFIGMETPLKNSGRRGNHLPAAGARRDQAREVGPGMGRGPHLEHDRDPARLVHLAAAHLGRADCCVSVQQVP